MRQLGEYEVGLANLFSECLRLQTASKFIGVSIRAATAAAAAAAAAAAPAFSALAVLHTSASLTINENASPDVPLDLNVSIKVVSAVQPVLLVGQDSVGGCAGCNSTRLHA
jgi:thiamine phosphate synthase YjbQ (UPF0047 family)